MESIVHMDLLQPGGERCSSAVLPPVSVVASSHAETLEINLK
jgi:hypothetical protein